MIGLDDTWYQPDLATLILNKIGLDAECDAVNDFYYSRREHHCKTLRQNDDNLIEHALGLYGELVGKTSTSFRPEKD